MSDLFSLDSEGNQALENEARTHGISAAEVRPEIGYLVGTSLGEALGSTLILFSVFAIVYQRVAAKRLSFKPFLGLLAITTLTVAALNVVIYVARPTQFFERTFNYLTLVQVLLGPALVSYAVLSLYASSRSAVQKPVARQRRLDTPQKRLFLLVAIGGVSICLGAFGAYEISDQYVTFLSALLHHQNQFTGYKIAMAIGCVMALCGGLLAYYYDETLGQIVNWVRTGGSAGQRSNRDSE